MFSTIINKFRSICCCNSNKSNHVACLVKGRRKLVSACMNDYRRQYISRRQHTSMHAEVGCLKDNKNLLFNKKIKKNLSLLILRYRKDGSLCDSRPCADCKEFLLERGFDFVYCSISGGSIEKFYLKDIPNYLSSSQIQFKIFGLNNLNKNHTKKLSEMGLSMEILQNKPLNEQLDILTIIKKSC